jgi:hypothetical protein
MIDPVKKKKKERPVSGSVKSTSEKLSRGARRVTIETTNNYKSKSKPGKIVDPGLITPGMTKRANEKAKARSETNKFSYTTKGIQPMGESKLTGKIAQPKPVTTTYGSFDVTTAKSQRFGSSVSKGITDLSGARNAIKKGRADENSSSIHVDRNVRGSQQSVIGIKNKKDYNRGLNFGEEAIKQDRKSSIINLRKDVKSGKITKASYNTLVKGIDSKRNADVKTMKSKKWANQSVKESFGKSHDVIYKRQQGSGAIKMSHGTGTSETKIDTKAIDKKKKKKS